MAIFTFENYPKSQINLKIKQLFVYWYAITRLYLLDSSNGEQNYNISQ